MANLVKYEYINDLRVYKFTLTEEMLQLWNEDEEKFWGKYGDEVNDGFEFSHDKIGDPNDEYSIEED
jgi:hypothetical protein